MNFRGIIRPAEMRRTVLRSGDYAVSFSEWQILPTIALPFNPYFLPPAITLPYHYDDRGKNGEGAEREHDECSGSKATARVLEAHEAR
jgi:hypothetical protein